MRCTGCSWTTGRAVVLRAAVTGFVVVCLALTEKSDQFVSAPKADEIAANSATAFSRSSLVYRLVSAPVTCESPVRFRDGEYTFAHFLCFCQPHRNSSLSEKMQGIVYAKIGLFDRFARILSRLMKSRKNYTDSLEFGRDSRRSGAGPVPPCKHSPHPDTDQTRTSPPRLSRREERLRRDLQDGRAGIHCATHGQIRDLR